MNLYFFCAVDDNPVYQREAEILIQSGRVFGRAIHLHRIPPGERWNRYKVDLFLTDLPPADRYIYLDSDTILTDPGDWESPECQGVADVLYWCTKYDRLRHTTGFMRNHTICDRDAAAWEYVSALWHQWQEPIWCNSGVVVLDAAVRLPFCRLWKKWLTQIDGHCARGFVEGDEYALVFARQEFGLPLLPPRFNCCLKWMPVPEPCHLLHADGNVTWPKRQPYLDAIARIAELEMEKRP